MESLIAELRSQSVTVQALAVSIGGLIGVFATLAIFFLVIRLSNRLGGKKT